MRSCALLDALRHTLWVYDARDPVAVVYSWFNVAEAMAWFAIALYVGQRYIRYRRTPVEVVYVLLFVLFGISDLVESQRVDVWLIPAKGLIFAGLLWARHHLLRNHYMGWRM